RIAKRTPRHLVDRRALPSTDGVRIRLPDRLPVEGGRAAERFRLLALVQASRVWRGTPRMMHAPESMLERDLFLLSEHVAADRWLRTNFPGVAAELDDACRADLDDRPDDGRLTPPERAVEALLRGVLADGASSSIPDADTPDDSLAWARETARSIAGRSAGRYRGLRQVGIWGRVTPPPPAVRGVAPRAPDEDDAQQSATPRVRPLVRRPRVREATDDEDDESTGMWMVQIDDPQEHVEDPMGLQRPADRDTEADADDLADSVSELEEARLVAVPGTPAEVLASEDPPDRTADRAPAATVAAGTAYPEWDWRLGAYLPAHAIVRDTLAAEGPASWADEVRRRHARERREIRRRFERLRAHRERLVRQVDGDDVDLDAWVTSWADACAAGGGAMDDRLYERVQHARRDVAISLLVDVSGSTDSWVADHRRIIDVEKEALVLVAEALDALGDRYAILAFSGEGPRGVAVRTLKRFDERQGAQVGARIAGLEHDRYTRLGAAIRHASAGLARERARHRLLLVLSDGKPNDVDRYEGRYGVEDSRQAVAEARLQGISPFCLTVDRAAPVYLPRIFGPGAWSVLRRPERLPGVLVDAVRLLLKR
ncbi:MAG TPA: VWA domain-containing protein, partial [Gemmatimonadaceae bacterium]|nr:VWA domain-containing protein [Gemmatimonadaceae bacterium]